MDPNALEVALINLATNARDAMPAGGRLTVTAANVTLRRGDDTGTGLGGDYVAITVADTGRTRAPEPPASTGGRVLLVEDNAEVARAIAGMLESLDFGHVIAPDGSSALALLQDGPAIDLVLSDIMLGAGMSALQAACADDSRRVA